MKGKLILENGMVFNGTIFGEIGETVGELVFNTGVSGIIDRSLLLRTNGSHDLSDDRKLWN